MSREELVEIVRRVMANEGTEEEIDHLLDVLEANVPHPRVSDLIFYPAAGTEPTPEEVVDEALGYRPIICDWHHLLASSRRFDVGSTSCIAP